MSLRADDPVGTEHDSEHADCAADPVCGGDHPLGGQAVLEGVMMRGRRSWGVAVRRPSGEICHYSFPLSSATDRYPVLKRPVLRGMMALGQSLSLGVKALGLSANLSLEDGEGGGHTKGPPGDGSGADEPGGTGDSPTSGFGWKEMALSIGLAAVLAIVLFIAIPLGVVKYFEETFSNPFVFNLVEGLIRIGVFLGYVLAISLIPDLQRVFQYHGAEHKVIHAYEAGEDYGPKRAGRFSTLHPRCGTAFLLVVMVMAILVFTVVGKPSLFLLIVSRLVGIPVVAGLSYEVIRYAGRHKEGALARGLLWPGLLLQRLTTREPSPEQIEVAAQALSEVLRVEAGGEPATEGVSPERIGEPAGSPSLATYELREPTI